MSTVLGLANRFLTRDKGQSTREPTRNEGVGVSCPDNKECEGVRREGDGHDAQKIKIASLEDEPPQPGILTLNEDAAGGMGRHLGVFSCTLLIVGSIIGTGIFSTPSSILTSVHSVGASLLLWALGFALSFCGLFVWLELGTMFPRSGGEKVYLEAVHKKTKVLATVVFAANAVLLASSAGGSVVFASNILVSAGVEPTKWIQRGLAIGTIALVVLIHGFIPRMGVWLMNALGIFKILILLFIVISGWVVLSGHTSVSDPLANFQDAFSGSSRSGGDYATALFKVLFTYSGWSSLNYVLNEVHDPVQTLKIAGPLGLAICAILYILVNMAYFAAASKDQIQQSGVTVAALFFKNVFGEQAQRALTVFIALSAFGNVLTTVFIQSRVNQELAKEGIPFPFGNEFWASNWPTGKSPLPGLILHFIPSFIVIIAPPPSVVYPFILDVQGYPTQIIEFLTVLGLFYLRWTRPSAKRPFRVWIPLALFFCASAIFLIVFPFVPPSDGMGDTPPLPYYLYCLVGIGVLLFGVFYWVAWRVALPRFFRYGLSPRKVVLSDGTVVTMYDKVYTNN